jgi:excisionase family DNA binding protein
VTTTQLLTIPEAAALLRCGKTHMYELIAAGQLRVVDMRAVGSKRPKSRIREDDLATFIESRTRTVS